MSKAAALGATGVVGAGGAALVGAHQLGAFGGSDNYKISTTTAQLTNHNGQCLDKTFGEGKWEIPQTVPTFTKKTVVLGSLLRGCLAINWDKEKKSEDKWGGNFRFVWSAFNGAMGFVLYLSGTTEEASGGNVDMKFEEGAAYYITGVSRQVGNGENRTVNKWQATEKLSFKPSVIKLTHSELSTKFPVLSDTLLKNKNGVDGYLDFFDSSKKKIKPLEKSERGHRYARWVLRDSTEDQVDPWQKDNFEKWWSHFFDKDTWDLSGTVSYIKKGTWELEALSG